MPHSNPGLLGPRYPLTSIDTADRGRCLICLSAIPKGATIETAPVQVLPPALARRINAYHLDFFVAWGLPGQTKTLAVPLGLFGLCNHSDDPTAELLRDYESRLVHLRAARHLAEGSEITLRYRDPSRSYPARVEHTANNR
jgi:hypothetical protein